MLYLKQGSLVASLPAGKGFASVNDQLVVAACKGTGLFKCPWSTNQWFLWALLYLSHCARSHKILVEILPKLGAVFPQITPPQQSQQDTHGSATWGLFPPEAAISPASWLDCLCLEHEAGETAANWQCVVIFVCVRFWYTKLFLHPIMKFWLSWCVSLPFFSSTLSALLLFGKYNLSTAPVFGNFGFLPLVCLYLWFLHYFKNFIILSKIAYKMCVLGEIHFKIFMRTLLIF